MSLLTNNKIINSANFNSGAKWNNMSGNVTTVGTNGGPSFYGTYDMSGNVFQWNDLNVLVGPSRGLRGGSCYDNAFNLSSSIRTTFDPSGEGNYIGFRLASSLNPLNFSNFVEIGDVNNLNHTTGYGNVNYVYRIAKYVVTNSEYVEFLNSVAATDTYNLYSTGMSSDNPGGINRSGSSGTYSYSTKPNMSNKPVVFVSWFDCARYCNWLHNDRPVGSQNNSTTEDGAYSLNGAVSGNAVARNANAKYHIPTENEWYKAAYYTPDKNGSGPGYWKYATQSDSDPVPVSANSVGDGVIPASVVQPKIKKPTKN